MGSLLSSQVSYFYQDLFCVFAAISLDVTLKIATLFQATWWPSGGSKLSRPIVLE